MVKRKLNMIQGGGINLEDLFGRAEGGGNANPFDAFRTIFWWWWDRSKKTTITTAQKEGEGKT